MENMNLVKPEFQVVLGSFYAIALPIKAEHRGYIWIHDTKQISKRL